MTNRIAGLAQIHADSEGEKLMVEDDCVVVTSTATNIMGEGSRHFFTINVCGATVDLEKCIIRELANRMMEFGEDESPLR